MSVTRVHTLYAVQVGSSVLGATTLLDQVTDFNVDPRISEIVEAPNGALHPTFAAILTQDPRIRFSTSKLATFLDAVGYTAKKVEDDATYDGFEAWLEELDNAGNRKTGSSHLKISVPLGMLVPRRISAGQRQIARVESDVLAIYDGTNAPVAFADTSALEGTPEVSEIYVNGPVNINGTQVPGVQSVEIDLGPREEVHFGDGDVWPTFAAVPSQVVSILVTTLHAVSLATFGISGAAQGATDSEVYFRKVANYGMRVAPTTEEHIKVSMEAGRISCGPASDAAGRAGMFQIRLTPVDGGVNGVLGIDTTSAIA